MFRRVRFVVSVALAILLSLGHLVAVHAADGDLDTTFSVDGELTTDFTRGLDRAAAVAIQTDGNIVVAGGANGKFALARYSSDGTLDPAFGGDGKVMTGFRRGASAAAIAIQADGKIIAAGGANGKFALVRYNADGTLDLSFGGDGKSTTDFTEGFDRGEAVEIQTDGKIIVAGSSDYSRHPKFALARYNTDGTLDLSFGGDGRVTTNIAEGYDRASAVAIQADGRIVVAGDSACDFALARYITDGALDTTFGGDGKLTAELAGFLCIQGEDVAIQSDGRIVAAGWGECLSSILMCDFDFALARYNSDGTPDTTFGEDGHIRGGFDFALARAVSIQADGKIVAVGEVDFAAEFAVARFNSDGTTDATFGLDGRVTTGFARPSAAQDVAIQADGRIVAAGWFLGKNEKFAVVGYLAS